MSRTLGGDLLRLLAAGGINAATSALGQLITTPLKTSAEAKLLGTRALLTAGGTTPEEGMEPWANEVKRLTNVNWPSYMAPTGKVVDEIGNKLAMTPVAGAPVTPEIGKKFVHLPTGLSEVLGSSLQAHPEMIPDVLGVKTGLKASAGQLLQDAQKAASQEIQRTRDEANQLLKTQQFGFQEKGLALRQEAMQHATDAAMAKIQLLNAEHDRKVKEGTIKAEDAAAHEARRTLGNQAALVMKATDPNIQGAMADQYNAQLTEAQKIHGSKLGDLKPLPVVTQEPGAIAGFFGAQPKRRLGQEAAPVAPSGETPATAAPTAAKTIVKTGTVQSGPNKGKRVVLYSDGTQSYE